MNTARLCSSKCPVRLYGAATYGGFSVLQSIGALGAFSTLAHLLAAAIGARVGLAML
jgi:hypothetical protein